MTRGVSEPTPLVIVTIPFHSIRAQCSPVWRMTVEVIRDLHSRYTRCGDCTSLEFPIAQNSANRIKSSLTEIQAQQPPDIAKFERNHKWKRSHSDNIAGLLREQVILPRTALVHIKMCDPKMLKLLVTKTAIAIVIITRTPIGALIIFQSIKSYHKSPLGHALTDRYKTQTPLAALRQHCKHLSLIRSGPVDRLNYPLERID